MNVMEFRSAAGFLLCGLAGVVVSALPVLGLTVGLALFAVASALVVVSVRSTGDRRAPWGIVAGVGASVIVVAALHGYDFVSITWTVAGLVAIVAATVVWRRTSRHDSGQAR